MSFTDIPFKTTLRNGQLHVLFDSNVAKDQEVRTTGDHWHIHWKGQAVTAVQLLNVRVPLFRQAFEATNTARVTFNDTTNEDYTLDDGLYTLSEIVAWMNTFDFKGAAVSFVSLISDDAEFINGVPVASLDELPTSQRLRMRVVGPHSGELFRSFKFSINSDFTRLNFLQKILGFNYAGDYRLTPSNWTQGGATSVHYYDLGFPKYYFAITKGAERVVLQWYDYFNGGIRDVKISENSRVITETFASSQGVVDVIEQSREPIHFDPNDPGLVVSSSFKLGFDNFQFTIEKSEAATDPAPPGTLYSITGGITPALVTGQKMRNDFIIVSDFLRRRTRRGQKTALMGFRETDALKPNQVETVELSGRPRHFFDDLVQPLDGTRIELVEPLSDEVIDFCVVGIDYNGKVYPVSWLEDGWTGILRLHHS